MSDDIDRAKEAIGEAGEHGQEGGARTIAVLIAALAAALALSDMAEKGAQNDYLTHHIQAADDWNFYQAKNIRSNLYALQADVLESLPGAADPAQRKRIDAVRAEAKRLDDDAKSLGRKQLGDKARASERERDDAFHRFHLYEMVVGVLQISIVLASVSVVTRVRQLALAAAILGGGASLFGLAEALNLLPVLGD